MGTCKVVTLFATTVALILSIILYVRLDKKESENFKNVAVGNCAYGLGGNNVAFCNDWITAYRKGQPCYSGCDLICCKKALECCNYLGTCDGGKDCKDPNYTPTKANNKMYDEDYYTDE